jgi:YD repeat-containing protein
MASIKLLNIRGRAGQDGTDGAPGGSDQALTDWINDLSSKARKALAVAFAPRDGHLDSVARDTTGRIASFIEDGVTTTLSRDSAGRVSSYTTSDGVTRTVNRDASGRIVSVS